MVGPIHVREFSVHWLRHQHPQPHRFAVADISDLPLYDDDLRLAGYPEPAARLRRQLAEADAVVLSTPEYNYSVSGVLKNAIDWASRPPDQPFARKPVALLSGVAGTLLASPDLLVLPFVRGVLNYGDPMVLMVRPSGGEWLAFQGAPPPVLVTGDSIFAIIHPGESERVVIGVFRRNAP